MTRIFKLLAVTSLAIVPVFALAPAGLGLIQPAYASDSRDKGGDTGRDTGRDHGDKGGDKGGDHSGDHGDGGGDHGDK